MDIEKADQRIGAAVRAVRGEMSQQDLAEKMRAAGWKWTQATVWSVESGKRPLRLAEARTLAELLRTDLSRLLKDDTQALGSTVGLEKATARLTRSFDELQSARGSFEDSRSTLEQRLDRARQLYQHSKDPDPDLSNAIARAENELEFKTAERAITRGVNEFEALESAAHQAEAYADGHAEAWNMMLDGEADDA